MTTSCASLVGPTLVQSELGLLHLHQLASISAIPGHPAVEVGGASGPLAARCRFRYSSRPLRRLTTESGFTLIASAEQDLAIMDASGRQGWSPLGEIRPGDRVPLRFGNFVGPSRPIPLPILGQAYYAGNWDVEVPLEFTPELAELVGYFMGDGSLHEKGLRFCVAAGDHDVRDRVCGHIGSLFGARPKVRAAQGYSEVSVHCTRLARWWEAAGLAKWAPSVEHHGKGWTPHVPAAIRESNCPEIYSAFLRGLFEADGTVQEGVPSLSSASVGFVEQVRAMMLSLSLLTTTRTTTSGLGSAVMQLRLRNVGYVRLFASKVGFMGQRKTGKLATDVSRRPAKRDRVILPRECWDELVPVGNPYRSTMCQALRVHGGVAREAALAIQVERMDARLAAALDCFYEVVREVGDEQPQPLCDVRQAGGLPFVANGFLVR